MARPSDYYLQLNDDGTPRRKHDIEEQESRRPVFFSVAGLVFFNAFAILKTFWFGDDTAHAHDHGRPGGGGFNVPQLVASDRGDELSGQGPALFDPDEAGKAEAELPAEAGYVRGSGLKFALSPLDLNFSDTGAIEASTVRLGPPLAPPGNDNVSLYGAAPGKPIILADSPPFGSGGSGGAAFSAVDRDEDDTTDDATDGTGEDGSQTGGSGSGGGSGGGGSSGDPRSNRLPVVSNVVLLSALLINEARTLHAADLLLHAFDADGDTLEVTNVKASVGHVVSTAAGGWLYIPEFNDRSVVQFSYEISDDHGSIVQTAFMPILPGPHVPLEGTDDDDELSADPAEEALSHVADGGDGDDTIRTGSGDDVVYGGSGDDFISTGAGNDAIFAGAGNDVVDAGDGDDYAAGEDGDDELQGGAGNDRLEGGAGSDMLWGGEGDDVLVGGSGTDVVDGGSGQDVIYGEVDDGDDLMTGGDGNDVYIAASYDGADSFTGGNGDDVFYAAEFDGRDVFDGGEGDDVYVAAGVGDGDTFHGGSGCDTYDASSIEQALIIDLSAGTVALLDDTTQNLPVSPQGDVAPESSQAPERTIVDPVEDIDVAADQVVPPVGVDLLDSVENVVGGQGDDVIIASDEVNELAGSAGADTFVFQTLASAGSGKGSRDKIMDFDVGDRIDIDDISEEFEREFNDVFDDPGIRKFVLIAQGQEFTQPGQIRFKYDEADDATILEGNVDFDSDTDFEIEILGAHELRYDSYVYST